MDKFIGIYENAAPQDYCDRMIAEFHKQDGAETEFSQQHYGGVRHRKDKAIFFDQTSAELTKETKNILTEVMKDYLDKHVGLALVSLLNLDVKVQETKPQGGYHIWHCEDSPRNNTRALSWIIYLNSLPTGEAETEFIEQGVRVSPEAGKIVLFPSAWTHTHRGNPPYSENKYIATGWYTMR